MYGENKESIFKDNETLQQMQETTLLDYFTHFIIRQFENLNLEKNDINRFRLQILFCAGCINDSSKIDLETHQRPLEKYIIINDNLSLNDFLVFIDKNKNLAEEEDNLSFQEFLKRSNLRK